MYLSSLSPLLLAACASAATVTYNWAATWVNAAPDGFARPVIGINGVWPCPKIEANVGDTVVVVLENQLGNETTGLHFHGINQINSDWMDGPSGVTQCPVPPGNSITYSFLVSWNRRGCLRGKLGAHNANMQTRLMLRGRIGVRFYPVVFHLPKLFCKRAQLT